MSFSQARRSFKQPKALAALVISTFGSAAVVQAQAPVDSANSTSAIALEEILVTATRTGETNVQSTPIAISAFSADRLALSGANDVQSLAALTPGLQVSETGPYPQIYLRGVGTNLILGNADPSTTVHLDGVYMARPYASYSQFLDVERVEVLRGPQGVLYGRNSAGGTINVVTRDPSEHFAGKAQVTVGNDNWRRASAVVGGPLTDTLSASLAAIYSERDGLIENVAAGGDYLSDDTKAVRGKLRFAPSDSLSFVLTGDYSRNDGIPAPNTKLTALKASFTTPINTDVLSDTYRASLNFPADARVENLGGAFKAEVQLSDEFSLQSITAYRENQALGNSDSDGTELALRESELDENQDQFTQEFLANYNGSRWQAVAGLFYLEENVDSNLAIRQFHAPLQQLAILPEASAESYSAFGNLSFDITDRLSASAGVRYVNDKKSIDQDFSAANPLTGAVLVRSVFEDEVEADAWTPKFGLNFEITPDVMVYASASKGFKSGGINTTATAPGLGVYDPESLWAYEVGVKSDLFDNRLRLNAAAFHYDYKDLQAQQIVTVPVAALVIANAATAEIDGVELEWQASIASSLKIGGFANWLDARYGDYTAIIGNLPAPATDQQMVQAPEWKFGLFVDYRYELAGGGAIFAFSDATWQDDTKFAPSFNTLAGNVDPVLADALTQQAYTVVNARLGYESSGGWRVAAFARNALDEEYYVSGDATPFPGYAGQPGVPLVYGVELTLDF